LSDAQLNQALAPFVYDACDALVEVKGPVEPLLRARSTFGQLEKEGKLRGFVRQVLITLDMRIAKIQRQHGRSDEVRKRIGMIESELDCLRGVGPPNWYPYNMACVYAQLSGLVGRPGTAPSPAERDEIEGFQDRAVDWFRRAVATPMPGLLEAARGGDPDLPGRSIRPVTGGGRNREADEGDGCWVRLRLIRRDSELPPRR
jgi:hypothetical protein